MLVHLFVSVQVFLQDFRLTQGAHGNLHGREEVTGA